MKASRAMGVSLLVVRAFVQLCEMSAIHKELAAKRDELERRVSSHDRIIAGLGASK